MQGLSSSCADEDEERTKNPRKPQGISTLHKIYLPESFEEIVEHAHGFIEYIIALQHSAQEEYTGCSGRICLCRCRNLITRCPTMC
jgi:hypothetical protein